MSTRYVYEIYNAEAEEEIVSSGTTMAQSNQPAFTACDSYTYKYDKNYLNLVFTPSGSSENIRPSTGAHIVFSVSEIGRFIISDNQYYYGDQSTLCAASSSSGYWHFTKATSGTIGVYLALDTEENSSKKISFDQLVARGIKGASSYGNEASSSKNLTEGIFTDGDTIKWREYLGSDSIDPSSVTYSTSSPTYGKPITIRANTVSPTYGGTIYYQFSYSTDGGTSWTDIGSKSTTASASVTIPSGATQFKGRVRTSDDLGFTSTTYVTGSNLTVSEPITYYKVTLSVSPSEGGTVSGGGTYASGSSVTVRATPNDGYKFVRWTKGGSTVSTSSSYRFTVSESTSLTAVFEEEIKAYVGIGGKAVALKKGYVGVSGVAKELVKGYVGVGGVAKKLF